MFSGECRWSWTFAINDTRLELDEQRQDMESLFENDGDDEVHPSEQFSSMRLQDSDIGLAGN